MDVREASGGDSLFARIGAFLAQHRLSPEPVHYAFAFEVVSNQHGAIAKQVARITDGGVRLTAQDIAGLGYHASTGAPVGSGGDDAPTKPTIDEAVVVRALAQVEGFGDTVAAIHAETGDFGRDLRASADAIRDVGPQAGAAEIGRLAAEMIDRVQRAEAQLERAQRESEELRTALDEARGSARTDTLTELPNRRAFDETFAALAPHAPVVVAICDIDHFKRINDQFGHVVGDRVLRAVARTLAAEIDCTVVRYGGEEFALLFEGVNIADAALRIDRARAAVEARQLRERETDTPIGTVSFSAGVAAGFAHEGKAPLMIRADRALYDAKNAGRGRTKIAA